LREQQLVQLGQRSAAVNPVLQVWIDDRFSIGTPVVQQCAMLDTWRERLQPLKDTGDIPDNLAGTTLVQLENGGEMLFDALLLDGLFTE
jgi:hypothetical protein